MDAARRQAFLSLVLSLVAVALAVCALTLAGRSGPPASPAAPASSVRAELPGHLGDRVVQLATAEVDACYREVWRAIVDQDAPRVVRLVDELEASLATTGFVLPAGLAEARAQARAGWPNGKP